MLEEVNGKFKAVILDMDVVIIQNAKLHASAWKMMFDEFLLRKNGPEYLPMDIEKDYKKYFDGISEFEGVRNFLESRGIKLPDGAAKKEEEDTVNGLGMRKDEIFLNLLDKEGADVYPDTLELVRNWKSNGIKLAVISASRNCRRILEAAGIADLFDVRVDGQTLQEENLQGKPEPDIFQTAADRLGFEVNQCVVIEDAFPGVEAGKKGKVLFVVGVARNEGEESSLTEAGADLVVKDLGEVMNKITGEAKALTADELPDALAHLDRIMEELGSKTPVLFLDYDGTLTPIVSDPEEAIISEKARNIVRELSSIITVGVISGRDRQNVAAKVNLENIIYAGSHGFDITGPDDLEMQYEPGIKILPILDEAENNLKEKLKGMAGAQVERKKYAIAVHYRNVAEGSVQELKNAVNEELKQQDKLKIGAGKKILELKPDLDWHKGKALSWLLEKLELKSDKYVPFFIGDDVTDEDALKVIKDTGIGIIVGLHEEKTSAGYRLEDTDEVIRFLDKLKNRLKDQLQKQDKK